METSKKFDRTVVILFVLWLFLILFGGCSTTYSVQKEQAEWKGYTNHKLMVNNECVYTYTSKGKVHDSTVIKAYKEIME